MGLLHKLHIQKATNTDTMKYGWAIMAMILFSCSESSSLEGKWEFAGMNIEDSRSLDSTQMASMGLITLGLVGTTWEFTSDSIFVKKDGEVLRSEKYEMTEGGYRWNDEDNEGETRIDTLTGQRLVISDVASGASFCFDR